jgi:hypothetical protein
VKALFAMTFLDIWFQAEVQKMRVEMAAMKRDAEHYSRQVTSDLSCFLPLSHVLYFFSR